MSLSNFDTSAATWRSAIANQQVYLAALAARLEHALPGTVDIVRESALFSRRKPIKSLSVKLGDHEYSLYYSKKTGLQASIGHAVCGITLKRDETTLPEWLKRLDLVINQYATQYSQNESILEEFLL